MAMFRRRQVGINEKAAKIAVKLKIIYSPKNKIFIGDPDQCDKATRLLKEWSDAQALKDRPHRREW